MYSLSLDVTFTSATVRIRSRDCSMAVPMTSSAEGGHFGRFETSCCFVSRGMFCTVPKVALCGRCNAFAMFSKDVLQLSWLAQNFERVHSHFAWQGQHFRSVACSLHIALAGLHEVATRRRYRGTHGIL